VDSAEALVIGDRGVAADGPDRVDKLLAHGRHQCGQSSLVLEHAARGSLMCHPLGCRLLKNDNNIQYYERPPSRRRWPETSMSRVRAVLIVLLLLAAPVHAEDSAPVLARAKAASGSDLWDAARSWRGDGTPRLAAWRGEFHAIIDLESGRRGCLQLAASEALTVTTACTRGARIPAAKSPRSVTPEAAARARQARSDARLLVSARIARRSKARNGAAGPAVTACGRHGNAEGRRSGQPGLPAIAAPHASTSARLGHGDDHIRRLPQGRGLPAVPRRPT
jgi:hypothetical protein